MTTAPSLRPASFRSRLSLRRALTLILTLAAFGLPLSAVPSSVKASSTSDGSAGQHASARQLGVEEILARHYEAIGGDRHQHVQTMKVTGTSVVMGMEAPYARYTKRPDKMLLEIYVEDMTGIQAFDGETAWSYMPFAGQTAPAPVPSEQARGLRDGADFDGPLVNATAKGHRVELLGIEPVRGRDAYALQVTLASGAVQTHYVDVETFYVTRTESDEGEAVFLDYRLIDGHPVPSVIEMVGPWGEQIVYIDDVAFNVEIADERFSMR